MQGRTALIFRMWAAQMAVVGLCGGEGALAADAPPGHVIAGSPSVMVGGRAAVRQGDQTNQRHRVIEGSTNVMINGRPAVTVGDGTDCGGKVVTGASSVLINGRPVARVGDVSRKCIKR